jgi:ArsR family transcriptional regulator
MTLRIYALVRISGLSNIIGMRDTIAVLAALAEPTRLSALQLLSDGNEHCVCELMRRLGASQSRMSRHMAQLKRVGLVIDRRDAQWVRYRRNPDLEPPLAVVVEAALATLAASSKRRRVA